MAKKWSNENLPGALHFVTGNVLGRKQIFLDEAACIAFMSGLQALRSARKCKLAAFVLMPDHFHLTLNPEDGDIRQTCGGLKLTLIDLFPESHFKAAKGGTRFGSRVSKPWGELDISTRFLGRNVGHKIVKSIGYSLLILTMYFCEVLVVAGQDWKQLVPLVSSCEDVKKALGIAECALPLTRHKSAKYRFEVRFMDRQSCKKNLDCRNESNEILESVSIGFNEGISLADFETDFSSYEIVPIPDLPDSLIYISKKKGIELTVVNYPGVEISNLEKYLTDLGQEKSEGLSLLKKIAIQHVLLFPTTENKKKCKCANKGGT